MNIVDYVLKEARVDKWSVLQDNQIQNMVNQFVANERSIQIEISNQKNVKKEVTAHWLIIAKKLNDLIVKKLNLAASIEKRLIIWLLNEVIAGYIDKLKIEEDAEVIKQNLQLYFENKKEILKIFLVF
jgi:hypothetical protein